MLLDKAPWICNLSISWSGDSRAACLVRPGMWQIADKKKKLSLKKLIHRRILLICFETARWSHRGYSTGPPVAVSVILRTIRIIFADIAHCYWLSFLLQFLVNWQSETGFPHKSAHCSRFFSIVYWSIYACDCERSHPTGFLSVIVVIAAADLDAKVLKFVSAAM